MKRKFYLIIVVFSITTFKLSAQTQPCNCLEEFKWMKQVMETSDAGFQVAIEKKGRPLYAALNKQVLAQLQTVKNKEACLKILTDWAHFFRSGHIGVVLNYPDTANAVTPNEIRAKFAKHPTFQLPKNALPSTENDAICGSYIQEDFEIEIAKAYENNDYIRYVAVTKKADSMYWMPGQIKFYLEYVKNTGQLNALYFNKLHKERYTGAQWVDKKTGVLEVANNYWFKKQANIDSDLKRREERDLLQKSSPYFKALSNATNYLRIPSFSYSEKKKIETVIQNNSDSLRARPNLIIDLRNNGGGTDESFKMLLRYISTNPILTVGMEFLSSENGIKIWQAIIDKNERDSASINEYKHIVKTFKDHKGMFVDLDSVYQSSDTINILENNIKNVVILINHNNISSAEEFLLAAKQSKKVKLMGVTTGGALDVSNVDGTNSPSNIFTFVFAMSKSYRIGKFPIDEIGLQPDIFMNDQINPLEWIERAKNYLEYNKNFNN